ncbi:TetR family transcriptional regulator [Saccharopolyspora erythraea NRRL 2338]|uniref:TetR-family transcriptional regulator n=2 Tax=Saccharopolyspora erythraea TaxID=1836 RepID=A4F9R3_SACEN|nr:TetR family transcriptional regulator [Saccharopolyspora erythraea]EQD84564.1 TetR family transcriptional regulator [Saccharopolyspora erythraea D]PFG94575.1 TetR family transcriptional regulator [Saccharopolyspora erythraea NRRL 2338]QRK91316.1 TetR family transcriptional regulator [Saccharopolyspora erythraea]CAM00788.1 TetR-family transcriptional regulator [Saccharopolyspora erythraea NRRL 2338]
MTEPATATDGRRARGQRRRAELIAATLAVVERDGVAGVTHRAVAREAGCPASSAVYYFATLDELLVAALSAAAEDYARQLREIVDSGADGIDGIARLIADAGGPGRTRAVAERELTLLAARRPALRPIARHWREKVADAAAEHTDDARTIRTVVDVADGICARVLVGTEPVTFEEIRGALRHALRLD